MSDSGGHSCVKRMNVAANPSTLHRAGIPARCVNLELLFGIHEGLKEEYGPNLCGWRKELPAINSGKALGVED